MAMKTHDRTGATHVTNGGQETVAIAAGVATDTVVSDHGGRLCRVLVTTTGTNPMNIYDNASAGSGKVIGCLPASPAVGSIYSFDMPAKNGITVDGHASNPGVTISFS